LKGDDALDDDSRLSASRRACRAAVASSAAQVRGGRHARRDERDGDANRASTALGLSIT
jgi:hypothetical protein